MPWLWTGNYVTFWETVGKDRKAGGRTKHAVLPQLGLLNPSLCFLKFRRRLPLSRGSRTAWPWFYILRQRESTSMLVPCHLWREGCCCADSTERSEPISSPIKKQRPVSSSTSLLVCSFLHKNNRQRIVNSLGSENYRHSDVLKVRMRKLKLPHVTGNWAKTGPFRRAPGEAVTTLWCVDTSSHCSPQTRASAHRTKTENGQCCSRLES